MKKTLLMLVCFSMLLTTIAWAGGKQQAGGTKRIKIVSTTRNISDGYWVEWNKGGQECADALGFAYQMISADDSETKQFSDMESAIAAGVDALVVMPMNNAVLPSIVELCEKNKILLVTMWDRPDDLQPDNYQYWVAHVTQDTYKQGYNNAITLFKGMGGRGNIVAIDGTYGTEAADLRRQGRENALKEFPNIRVLGVQSGEYNRVKTMAVMEDFIANYGVQINGVWGGNDEMALAAVEVLKTAGMINRVKVSGLDTIAAAVDAIRAGEMYSTLGGDGKGMHGLGCMIAYDAVRGVRPPHGSKIVYWNPDIITAENVEEYYQKSVANYQPHDWRGQSQTWEK